MHKPDWHMSVCVQALPSSQGVPSAAAGVLFKSIVTWMSPPARSTFPSPCQSPTVTYLGPSPTATGDPLAGENLPDPSPRKIERSEESPFATAKSSLPSPFQSPAAMERGARPTATGDQVASKN